MFDVKYTLCTEQTYNVPLYPGRYDITIGASVSPVTRARRESEHHEAQRAFKTNTAVESILKIHLKQAVPLSLIIEIEDDIMGLNDVTIVDILDHVQQRRGKMNDNLIHEKNAQFCEKNRRFRGNVRIHLSH